MFIYQVIYTNGTKEIIRANSPKQASEIAVKGTIAFIKFVRKL
jgi:hypothetical protein